MFRPDSAGGRIFAAAFAFSISAVFLAAAIVPASPTGVLA